MNPQVSATALSLGRLLGLITVALALGGGQLLFKFAAQRLIVDRGLGTLLHSFLTPPMAASLVVYAGATVLWVYLLHGFPLSRAYPFVALAFALVPLMSWLVFGEALGIRYAVGLTLMLCGLYVIATAK